MARYVFENERSQLMLHTYILEKDIETQRRFRIILDSATNPGSYSWLFALPNGGLGQRMTPLEFQAAISYRLLMPQFDNNSKCYQNRCKSNMDIYGYHAYCCSGHLHPRHQLVQKALAHCMSKAGFFPETDAHVTCLGHRNGQLTAFRPADILMAGDDFERDCVDVTVVSPIKKRNPYDLVVGKTAEDAELVKYNKHAIPCENAGFGFKAFAIDVFGVMAKKSYKLLQRIISKLIRDKGYPAYRATAIVLRRVSIAVQIGVARNLILCHKVSDD